MALVERGGQRYGDAPEDVREEISRYSALNGYPAVHFAEAVCKCGAREFGLNLDDAEGVAVRVCETCKDAHPMGDGADYMDHPPVPPADRRSWFARAAAGCECRP